jgi:4a-hydroxytetrahydrobiopterin dehydratase
MTSNEGAGKMSAEQVQHLLTSLPGWVLEDGALARWWSFPGFGEAMDFVNRVARMAEDAGHHPDIDIRYNRVKLSLISHDAGGITDRDGQMAARLSAELPEGSRT